MAGIATAAYLCSKSSRSSRSQAYPKRCVGVRPTLMCSKHGRLHHTDQQPQLCKHPSHAVWDLCGDDHVCAALHDLRQQQVSSTRILPLQSREYRWTILIS